MTGKMPLTAPRTDQRDFGRLVRCKRTLLSVGALCSVFVIGWVTLWQYPPRQHVMTFRGDGAIPRGGYAYSFRLSDRTPWPYRVLGDEAHPFYQSDALLQEDSRSSELPHAAHVNIREIGLGRYSHWGKHLFFSTYDNSDPRLNRRTYAVTVTAIPHPAIAITTVGSGLLALLLSAHAVASRRRNMIHGRGVAEAVPDSWAAARKYLSHAMARMGIPAAAAIAVGTALTFFTTSAILGLAERPFALKMPNQAVEAHAGRAFRVRVPSDRFGILKLASSVEPKSPIPDPTVLENGVVLSPANALHEHIAAAGAGAYFVSNGWLVFSASDNSDPRTNGRRYEITGAFTVSRAVQGALDLTGMILIMVASLLVALGRRQDISTTLSKLAQLRAHAAYPSAVARGGWLRGLGASSRRGMATLIAIAASWGAVLSSVGRALMMGARARMPGYLLGAAMPGAVSVAMLLWLLPIWNGTDSTGFFFWQLSYIPHFPPFYPGIMALGDYLLDSPRGMLRYVQYVQHACTVLAVAYFATAFQRTYQILVASAAASVGIGFNLYAHGIISEGLALPFLLVAAGSMVRVHFRGWSRSAGFACFFGLLGGALTRHIFIVFAMIPLMHAVLIQLSKGLSAHAARSALRDHWPGWLIPLLVIACNSLLTKSVCAVLDQDCKSIIGRAGVYRVKHAWNMVPAQERSRWLSNLAVRMGDKESGIALEIMARSENPWIGAYEAIGKDERVAGLDTDVLMNRAFLQFALTPDRYVMAQWWREFLHRALLGGGDEDVTQISRLLTDSAWSLQVYKTAEFPWDPFAEFEDAQPENAEIYLRIAQCRVFRAAGALLPIDAVGRASMLVLSFALALFAAFVCRNANTWAFVLAMWLGALTYLVMLSVTTIVLPRYLAPVDLLVWTTNGFSAVVLGQKFYGRYAASKP